VLLSATESRCLLLESKIPAGLNCARSIRRLKNSTVSLNQSKYARFSPDRNPWREGRSPVCRLSVSEGTALREPEICSRPERGRDEPKPVGDLRWATKGLVSSGEGTLTSPGGVVRCQPGLTLIASELLDSHESRGGGAREPLSVRETRGDGAWAEAQEHCGFGS
jgi:hypothetical protein